MMLMMKKKVEKLQDEEAMVIRKKMSICSEIDRLNEFVQA